MRYRYQWHDKVYEISVDRQGAGPKAGPRAGYRVTVNGELFNLEILDVQPGIINLQFEGQPITLYWANQDGFKWISLNGCTYRLETPAPKTTRRSGERALEDSVRSPMPAQVRAIQVSEGVWVEKGQTLLLLEAMKMEIRIQAPRSGRIVRLPVQEGQPVDRDQVLIEISDTGKET